MLSPSTLTAVRFRPRLTESKHPLPAEAVSQHLECHTPFSILKDSLPRKLTVVAVCGVRRNHAFVQRFRGGLVFKAHRLVYQSTPDSRVTTKKKKQYLTGRAGANAQLGLLLSHRQPGVAPAPSSSRSIAVPRLSLKCRGLCPLIRGQRNSWAKTARGVGVQLMLVLGDLIDTIRQQCAKFQLPSPRTLQQANA